MSPADRALGRNLEGIPRMAGKRTTSRRALEEPKS
jgi:hypothetical protein